MSHVRPRGNTIVGNTLTSAATARGFTRERAAKHDKMEETPTGVSHFSKVAKYNPTTFGPLLKTAFSVTK